ncbi:TlpA family protein disulfide reductase [Nocardia mexicana]|uniref:Thioredoxin domain-containing protein n=1 Tax=Nocardia mexicana TaxID=279262 RepID=A0A370GSP8_9NOCA|nr:hypothetical protein [Nocardia mexicana]RDI46728.1 hypothetical protein DFR68_110133 [Nocardia mexicana]
MSWPWIVVIVLLVVAVAAEGLLLIGLMARIAPVLEQAENVLRQQSVLTPTAGTALPEVDLRGRDGLPMDPAQWQGRPRVLVFVSVSCPACHDLLDDIRHTPIPAPRIATVLITSTDAVRHLYDTGLPAWLTIAGDDNDEFTNGLGIDATPLAVLIDEHNRVRTTSIPSTVDDLVHLTESTIPA